MAETQAEKNKRIEAGLKKAGKSFTPSTEVKAKSEKADAARKSAARAAVQSAAKEKVVPKAPEKRSSMPGIDAQLKKAGADL